MIFKWSRNWGNGFPRTGKETKVGTENEDRNEIERRHEGFPHSPTWTSRKSSSVCPHTDHRLWPQRKGGEERHLRQQGRCGESLFQWPIGVYRTRIPNLTNSWREIWMMEKKFPLPGEVLSENHQFRTPSPLSTNPRFSQGETYEVLLKTQSLRIENSEPLHPLVTNSRFSRGEGNKKRPRCSKRQSLRIENSEPSALSSVNSRFSWGEEREDRSVQDAPKATSLVRVWCGSA